MIDYNGLKEGFKNAGICSGDTVLIHSAMTPIGYVEGGAKTVAEALIDTVGKPFGVHHYCRRIFKHRQIRKKHTERNRQKQ